MNRSPSPTRSVLASDSAKLQDQIFKRLSSDRENKPSPQRVSRLPPDELLNRRIDAGRSPLSGVAEVIPDMDIDPSPKLRLSAEDLTTEKIDPNEILQSSQRINARILEAWINNTIIDAEHLEIPGALAKSEYQHPLSRYGIDRHSLQAAGISSNDINRIYKAMFVYSLGFYQLINKTMEHISGKYTYIAGVWKVYAILLEYCCKVDYTMVISAVQEEKRLALEQCEATYRGQIAHLQEKEEKSEQELEHFKQKIGILEHELQLEKHKREEMEEEIFHRGSGHEEEVELRIKFESKLNQMFAQQRDMETKQKQYLSIIDNSQRALEEKTVQIKDLSAKLVGLSEVRIGLEAQVSSLEDRLIHVQRLNHSLENRIAENGTKIENLKEEYTKAKESLQITQSELLQRTLIVDKLESEKQAIESQLLKVKAIVDGYMRERDQALARVQTLESSLKSEVARFLDMEQEYVRIREQEANKDKLISDFRKSSGKYFEELQTATNQLDSLRIQYDNQTVLYDQQCEQLQLAVSTIDEVTRARRLAEDRIEELKTRVEDLTTIKDELTLEMAAGKREVDKIRSQMAELEREVEVLEMKKRTSEKQYDTQKETLMQKIKNLSEILNSERKIRENWIEKFENEQKSNSDNMREAMENRRAVNDLQMQITTLAAKKDEALKRLENEKNHSMDARKQVSELKNKLEEADRKSTTLSHLIDRMEADWEQKMEQTSIRHFHEIEEVRFIIIQERMQTEDYRSVAQENLSIILELKEDIRKREERMERKNMLYEEIYSGLVHALQAIDTILSRESELKLSFDSLQSVLTQKVDQLSQQSLELSRVSAYAQILKSKIPDEFMDQPHPIDSLLRQIKELEATIDASNKVRLSKADKEVLTDPGPEKTAAEAQTDIGMAFFDIRPKSRSSAGRSKPGTPNQQRTSRTIGKGMIVLDEAALNVMETAHKPKDSSKSGKSKGAKSSPKSELSRGSRAFEAASKQSGHSKREVEDPTPIIMRSVYKHDASPQSSARDRSVSGEEISQRIQSTPRESQGSMSHRNKLPSLSVPKGPPPDIKSYIRQAVSRRKDDFDDMT